MFIWTGGVPGVGKSTIINKSLLSFNGSDQVRRVKTSELLLTMSGLRSRAELSKLGYGDRSILSDLVHEHLIKTDETEPETVQIDDGHFAITSPDGTLRSTMPYDERTAARTLCLVLFDCSTEQIIERMLKDKTERTDRTGRYTDIALLSRYHLSLRAQIDFHRDAEFQAARQVSRAMNKPLHIITNDIGELDHAVVKFHGLVSECLPRRLEYENKLGFTESKS